MRREAGAVGLVGILLALVVIALAAYLMFQSGGLLGGGGKEKGPTPIDQARVTSAIAELRMVKQGLQMYRTMSGSGSYPASDEISSFQSLRAVISSYAALPDSVSFTFSSYTSTAPDNFLLKVYANDTARTGLEVSSSFVPRRVEP